MAIPIAFAAGALTACFRGVAGSFLSRTFASATGPVMTGARGLMAPNNQIGDPQEIATESKPESAPYYSSLNPGGP